jgi:hypothetical protein
MSRKVTDRNPTEANLSGFIAGLAAAGVRGGARVH